MPEQAILAAPMGVVRLMDLLGDAHEVIRNEAVLLLTGLTRASADIQKIAAFEGAFDRILQILGCALHAMDLGAHHVPQNAVDARVRHQQICMPLQGGGLGAGRHHRPGLPRVPE